MKPKVYVTRLLPKEAMDRINSFCEVELWDGELPPPKEVLLEKVRDVEGLLFCGMIFLIAGIPGLLSMYLLINLPRGLLATWTTTTLILYLIGGVVAAKLIKIG